MKARSTIIYASHQLAVVVPIPFQIYSLSVAVDLLGATTSVYIAFAQKYNQVGLLYLIGFLSRVSIEFINLIGIENLPVNKVLVPITKN